MLRAEILEHLRAMCTTRRGSMRTRPDYGLPDISEMLHSFPDALSELAGALQHTIETYEPRLGSVRVRHLPMQTLSLILRLEITATMRLRERATPVRFETSVNASRKVAVV